MEWTQHHVPDDFASLIDTVRLSKIENKIICDLVKLLPAEQKVKVYERHAVVRSEPMRLLEIISSETFLIVNKDRELLKQSINISHQNYSNDLCWVKLKSIPSWVDWSTAVCRSKYTIFFTGSVLTSSVAKIELKSIKTVTLPDLPEDKFAHSAIVVADILYVLGGCQLKNGDTSYSKSMYSLSLNAITPIWISSPQLETGIEMPIVVTSKDGQFFVIGGLLQGKAQKFLQIFDIRSQSWSQAELPFACSKLFDTAVVIEENKDEKILILTPERSMCLTISSKQWSVIEYNIDVEEMEACLYEDNVLVYCKKEDKTSEVMIFRSGCQKHWKQYPDEFPQLWKKQYWL